MAKIMDSRAEFTEFCHRRYGSDDDEGECKKSKTVTAKKGERIVAVLKGSEAHDAKALGQATWIQTSILQCVWVV